MEKDDWENIKKHYSFLVDLNEFAQGDYLKKIDKKDPSLANKLREMLKADHDDPTFLSKPAFSKLKEIETPDFFIGKEIDRYKLLYLIGIGGMGNVYLAERTDLEAHQQVVVKIMNTGYLSSVHRKRFERERKILSRLNHPHITRIYDGGITEQGLPYIVMEFIEGKPLMEYVADNDLNIEERLELFIDICSAVSYAHQNFIMHRDLKPANILVTHHGIVKVIDFGIAKILEDDEAFEDQLTRTGILPMTPAYASPEQLANKPLTIASDVYSLGVVLYEILTENKPYPVTKNSDFSTIERIVTSNDPLKPSISVSPEISRFSSLSAWKKKIRGDLDNIILKALKKESSERYPSVEHLIDDLNRFKNNYPVLARPDSLTYRIKKYVRRHRIAVASVTAFFLVLILGIATTLWQANIAAEERDQARIEAAKARQITDFIIDLFENADPDIAIGEAITAEDMLTKGAENIDELEDQPELQAEMLRVIGDLYFRQRRFDIARAHTERSLSVFESTLGENHIETAITKFQLSEIISYHDEYTLSKKMFQDIEPIYAKHYGKNSFEYATLLKAIGGAKLDMGQYDDAIIDLKKAESIFEAIESPTHKQTKQIITNSNYIGLLYYYQYNYADAIKEYKKALELSKLLYGEWHQDIGVHYHNIASAYYALDEIDSSRHYAKNSVEVVNKIFGNKPNDRIISTNRLLAVIAQNSGDYDEAEKLIRESIEIAEKIFDKEHYLSALLTFSLGTILIKKEKFGEGEKLLLEATSIAEKTRGKGHPHLIPIYSHVAESYNLMGQYDNAVYYQQKAVAIQVDNYGDSPETQLLQEELDGYLAKASVLEN